MAGSTALLFAHGWAHHRNLKTRRPRASRSLHRAAQPLAAGRGRAQVLPDDVKLLATPALAHRLIMKTEARLRKRTAERIVADVVTEAPVQVEET